MISIGKNEENYFMKYFMIILYLVLTVSGLILYKKGTNQEFLLSITEGIFNFKISLISLIGLLCYLGSFLIYILILPKYNLTFIYPLMTSLSYIGIYLLSIFVLKETVTITGIIGSIIIMAGIVLVNIGR